MRCFVYMVRADKWLKIGVSHNVERRLKTMQTGCPHKLKLIQRFPLNSKSEAFALESLLHNHLKDCNRRGEWFDFKKVKKAMKFEVNGQKVALSADFEWRANALAM